MTNRLIQRAFSFSFAAVLTLAMLGGIGHLAEVDEPASGWAQQNAAPAPRA